MRINAARDVSMDAAFKSLSRDDVGCLTLKVGGVAEIKVGRIADFPEGTYWMLRDPRVRVGCYTVGRQ